MSDTKIDYLTKVWNPIAMRCTRVSPGCDHCWHLAMAKRHAANKTLRKEIRAARDGGEPWLNFDELRAPQMWRKPQIVGVQFMGDLFHDDVPNQYIGRVLGHIAKASPHTFLVLTKRAARLEEWSRRVCHYPNDDSTQKPLQGWPDNAWVGVSVENQAAADERIPLLLRTRAAHRWVSIEPMLGPVTLPLLSDCASICPKGNDCSNCDDGWRSQFEHKQLDWVVVGGESGPGARPMHPDWVRSIRDQCKSANVPFYFKAWGSNPDESAFGEPHGGICAIMQAKNCGYMLDGNTHREMPFSDECVRA